MPRERGAAVRLLRRDELDRLNRHLAGALDRTLRLEGSTGLDALSRELRNFVLAGGKRLRPQLCVWTYQHVANAGSCPETAGAFSETAEGGLDDLACAWELFHAFLLAHDDIIDNGDYRRSQPSLHKRLAGLDAGSRAFGTHLAIIGGDLLFAASMSLLHGLEMPADRYREVLRLFSRVAATTGFGQAIDVVQGHVPPDQVREDVLMNEYLWKTAAYTFEGPMVSGAVAAGADVGSQAALSRFAMALGQAYQLHNDLIDLATPARAGCDLAQGKRTITLLRARARLSPNDRAGFDLRLVRAAQGDGPALEEAENLRRDLLASGACALTADLVNQLLDESQRAASDPSLPKALQAQLAGLLSDLRASYFGMASS